MTPLDDDFDGSSRSIAIQKVACAFHKNCLFQIVVTRKPLIVQKWRSGRSCRESIGHSKKIYTEKKFDFFLNNYKIIRKSYIKTIRVLNFF